MASGAPGTTVTKMGEGYPSGVPAPDAGSDVGLGAGSDVGLGARLESARALLATVVSELDPDCLTGAGAAALYGSFAGLERLSMAGKTLVARRVEASGVWRDTGHRDAATMLAQVEGVSTGQARTTLAAGRRLEALPGTE